MSDLSHVTMEQHQCVVCCTKYDTGAILLDKQLRQRFERNTTTGLGLCPEHQALSEQGYVALIEIEADKSILRGNKCKPEDAYRTGVVAHIKASAWANVFDSEAPTDDEGKVLDYIYVEKGVINKLQQATQQETSHE